MSPLRKKTRARNGDRPKSISVIQQDGLDIIRLQHGKVNALDLELLQQLQAVLATCAESRGKAAVLTGSGTCFSAGVDLVRLVRDGAPYLQRFLPVLSSALRALFVFPKPIIAAVNGHAVAGGCLLAWACDHRMMAADSGRIGVAELKVGIPFPAIPLEIVRFAVPVQYFQEVIYGAESYKPETALAMGLLDAVVTREKLMGSAKQAAARYGAAPAEAFRLTKLTMRQPVIDRAERVNPELSRAIDAFWQTPTTIATIADYMQNEVGKK